MKKVYGGAIFLSSFLLFAVQPIIAKFILPAFGGSSQVWSVAMMFFMALLLAGYIYADRIVKIKGRAHAFLHLALVAATSLLLLALFFIRQSPIMPEVGLLPSGNLPPTLEVFLLLLVSVGLPYFLLTTTSSLLQFWWSKIRPHDTPYQFYRLSNAGSFLAILTYPFLIEPAIPLRMQGSIWSIGFFVYGAALSFCAVAFFKSREPQDGAQGVRAREQGFRAITLIMLAALPSLMLLATTNEITQQVAPVPFLWLLPLGLYLLSFIFAFSDKLQAASAWYPLLLMVSVPLLILVRIFEQDNFLFLVLVFSAVLFLISLVCHSRLYELKPPSEHLTEFYVAVAFGGALGGIFVSIISPLIFSKYWEFLLGLFLSFFLALWILAEKSRVSRFQYYLLLAMGVAALFFSFVSENKHNLRQARNFYGVLTVREDGDVRTLLNGKITHGSQFLDGRKLEPTTYYGRESGAGLILEGHPEKGSLRVGVIGLGVGTVARYCQEQDYFRFYEINPEVIKIARELFTYLEKCPDQIEIIEGDARLSLEGELEAGERKEFDVLIVDAFTDDSIPVHLLTREAFEIYQGHLARGGIMAVHISNKHLNLEPVVRGVAQEFSLSLARVESPSSSDLGVYRAVWLILAENDILTSYGLDTSEDGDAILWTDDYSDLFSILK